MCVSQVLSEERRRVDVEGVCDNRRRCVITLHILRDFTIALNIET